MESNALAKVVVTLLNVDMFLIIQTKNRCVFCVLYMQITLPLKYVPNLSVIDTMEYVKSFEWTIIVQVKYEMNAITEKNSVQ